MVVLPQLCLHLSDGKRARCRYWTEEFAIRLVKIAGTTDGREVFFAVR